MKEVGIGLYKPEMPTGENAPASLHNIDASPMWHVMTPEIEAEVKVEVKAEHADLRSDSPCLTEEERGLPGFGPKPQNAATASRHKKGFSKVDELPVPERAYRGRNEESEDSGEASEEEIGRGGHLDDIGDDELLEPDVASNSTLS
ncbi:hypothetical protein MMC22_004436 [Lobaria immixta]|nr:hypothetical protein [Lobaria immixta]